MLTQMWRMLTWPFRPGPRRPLARRRPEPKRIGPSSLGMEAVDMGLVDRVNRRNGALERVSTLFLPARSIRSFIEQSQTGAAPVPDDETYTAQYHRAYIEKKGSRSND